MGAGPKHGHTIGMPYDDEVDNEQEVSCMVLPNLGTSSCTARSMTLTSTDGLRASQRRLARLEEAFFAIFGCMIPSPLVVLQSGFTCQTHE